MNIVSPVRQPGLRAKRNAAAAEKMGKDPGAVL